MNRIIIVTESLFQTQLKLAFVPDVTGMRAAGKSAGIA